MGGMNERSDGFRLLPVPPEAGRYRQLRALSGLSPITQAQAERAIEGTWAWRSVVDAAGETVAMGRVVGDGGWYFLVADMATLPEHQGKGLGRAVLVSLLEAIRDRAEEGAYVTLTADPPGRRLYESLGFRDVAPGGTGMSLRL
jgi:GNAT superfamily N-acetyltransferase